MLIELQTNKMNRPELWSITIEGDGNPNHQHSIVSVSYYSDGVVKRVGRDIRMLDAFEPLDR